MSIFGTDFRVDLSPRTARQRLDHWQGIQAVHEARRYDDMLSGWQGGASEVEYAFKSLVRSQIGLAKAQLRLAADVASGSAKPSAPAEGAAA